MPVGRLDHRVFCGPSNGNWIFVRPASSSVFRSACADSTMRAVASEGVAGAVTPCGARPLAAARDSRSRRWPRFEQVSAWENPILESVAMSCPPELSAEMKNGRAGSGRTPVFTCEDSSRLRDAGSPLEGHPGDELQRARRRDAVDGAESVRLRQLAARVERQVGDRPIRQAGEVRRQLTPVNCVWFSALNMSTRNSNFDSTDHRESLGQGQVEVVDRRVAHEEPRRLGAVAARLGRGEARRVELIVRIAAASRDPDCRSARCAHSDCRRVPVRFWAPMPGIEKPTVYGRPLVQR